MRGEITTVSLAGRLAQIDSVELVERSTEAVVDDHVGELLAREQLGSRHLEPAFDRLRVVAPARFESPAQDLERRRRDEHERRGRDRVADLACPLNLELEQRRRAVAGAPLELA